MSFQININDYSNENCRKCSKEERDTLIQDGICSSVLSVIDNLPVRCIGKWGFEKIYMLSQYFGIFAEGMKKQWKNLNYIEICSGPGMCIIKEDGKEINGTPLQILKHQKFEYISRAVFIDNNEIVKNALNSRIQNMGVSNAIAINGDYTDDTELVEIIINKINLKSLNLVFIDPTDWSVPFNLIRNLNKAISRIDFIINIATGTDFNRNVRNVILEKNKFERLRTKYISFLDGEDFFLDQRVIKFAQEKKYKEIRALFRDYYLNKLSSIGYKYTNGSTIRNYYDIVFASKHPKGLDFWNKAQKYDSFGQKSLF